MLESNYDRMLKVLKPFNYEVWIQVAALIIFVSMVMFFIEHAKVLRKRGREKITRLRANAHASLESTKEKWEEIYSPLSRRGEDAAGFMTRRAFKQLYLKIFQE